MAYTTINKSTDYFNTVTYSGNGNNNHTITGVGFDADFVWNKIRNGADDHRLFDKVRGINKYLETNNNNAEVTDAILSTNSDGYVLTNAGEVNSNTGTYVGWNWKANGAGSTNYDGSITSTVSVNQTAGFSIVKWTGTGANATVGHGLGSTPKMIIAKQYSSNGGTEHWTVFHHTLDTNKNLYLNLANAEDTPSPEIYREGSFTNNVFAIGAHDRINNNTVSYIAYCFAEVPGYSKFGSYIGNGSTDGTFIYTGFKPAFLMIKPNAVENWHIFDNKRSPINVTQKDLRPNLSNAESDASASAMDFLSNGFKFYNADADYNDTGREYIYMAFGQSLVGSNNVPCTAR